jgi:hypothetical protein
VNPRVKFIRKATGEKNFLDEIRNTKRQVNRMETAEGLDSSVNETEQNLFMDTNETIITNGRLVTTGAESETTVAEEDGFIGTVVSGNGVTPFDEAGTFNLAIINDGETTYGVGQGGTYSNGMDFFNRQLATGTSTDQRQLRSGFQELQGNDDPSYIFEFLDTAVGANLITSNPDFETGDATGWTLSAGSAVVATSRYGWGSYCLELDNDSTDEATSNKYACSAGSTLSVNFETLDFSRITVYIRFYNAVPTLLSSSIVFSKTNEYFTGSVSGSVIVPIGATQFDIYIDRSSTAPVITLFDNFDVHVVTIANEFGFHGEDGQILMGNGKFKTNDVGAYIPRGSLSGVVFANNTRTAISTVGNTTVFDLTVPANFFSKGHIRIYFDVFTDANANNRTLTATLTLGASTAVLENLGTSTNVNRLRKFQASIGKGGTDVQDIFFDGYFINDNSTTVVVDGEYTQANETESETIALSLTLSLSGSVDAGWYNNVKVETVMNVEAW